MIWLSWWRWFIGDRAEVEPALTAWEKNAVKRLADKEYIFKRFLRPTILTKVWVMLSVYDVTPAQIASGYTQLGDAEVGGNFACAGYWEWSKGDTVCRYVDLGYPWRPAQVLNFMPPITLPDGTTTPATEVRDVNLLLGQPPREFSI